MTTTKKKEKVLEFVIQEKSFDLAVRMATDQAAEWVLDQDQNERHDVELAHVGTRVRIDANRRGPDVTLHSFEVYE